MYKKIYIYFFFVWTSAWKQIYSLLELQLNTPDLYHKEKLYLYGFVISVSRSSSCVMVDKTLFAEFDDRKTVLNMVMG